MAHEVSIDELETAIAQNAYVLDVREAWEFEAGHVPTAHHIPLNSVADLLSEIPRDQQVWVICQSGGRSMTAANYLEANGFDAVSVAGGTGSWIGAGKNVSFEASL
jgi:rhodanese-related sulfurtransferase